MGQEFSALHAAVESDLHAMLTRYREVQASTISLEQIFLQGVVAALQAAHAPDNSTVAPTIKIEWYRKAMGLSRQPEKPTSHEIQNGPPNRSPGAAPVRLSRHAK